MSPYRATSWRQSRHTSRAVSRSRGPSWSIKHRATRWSTSGGRRNGPSSTLCRFVILKYERANKAALELASSAISRNQLPRWTVLDARNFGMALQSGARSIRPYHSVRCVAQLQSCRSGKGMYRFDDFLGRTRCHLTHSILFVDKQAVVRGRPAIGEQHRQNVLARAHCFQVPDLVQLRVPLPHVHRQRRPNVVEPVVQPALLEVADRLDDALPGGCELGAIFADQLLLRLLLNQRVLNSVRSFLRTQTHTTRLPRPIPPQRQSWRATFSSQKYNTSLGARLFFAIHAPHTSLTVGSTERACDSSQHPIQAAVHRAKTGVKRQQMRDPAVKPRATSAS